MYVFHICFDLCVVYGVGGCVHVCGVVCVVVYLFPASGCCLLCCSAVCVGDFCLICDVCSWRCSFMGSMFRRVDVVCRCLLCNLLLF